MSHSLRRPAAEPRRIKMSIPALEMVATALAVVAMGILWRDKTSSVEMTPQKLVEMARAGGVLLGVLGGLSCWCIALCVERTWTYWRAQGGSSTRRETHREELDALVQSGQLGEAIEAAEEEGSVPSTLFARYLAGKGMDEARLTKSLADAVQLETTPYLAHHLDWIAALTRLAPMIGLLGTVWGMIGAFSSIASQMEVDPSTLAEHIGLALTTTAAGLGVAIPGIACHCFLTDWARAIEFRALKQVHELVGHTPSDETQPRQ